MEPKTHWINLTWGRREDGKAVKIYVNCAIFIFKALNDQAPLYIKHLILPYSSSRSFRYSIKALLHVPQSHLKLKGDRGSLSPHRTHSSTVNKLPSECMSFITDLPCKLRMQSSYYLNRAFVCNMSESF